jgi:peptide/nickel transport system permease protein
VDQVSWGTMLAEAQSELIVGHWWQMAAVTLFMAVFVTAFSLVTDAWRDALDPELRGVD